MPWCHGLDLATSTVYSMMFTDCSDLCRPHAALHSYTSATLHLSCMDCAIEMAHASSALTLVISVSQLRVPVWSCSKEDEQTAATEMKNVCSSGCHSPVLQLQQ